MRRPLKPFVTEYKPTNRRSKDGVFGAEPEAAVGEAPTRKPAKAAEPKAAQPMRRGEAQRSTDSSRYNGAHQEDGYEAAMRAADALFSGASQRTPEATHAAPKTQDVFTDHEGAPQPGTEPAQPGTGRILRVLDEEPNAALLEMEAERAPKRRGRKPGSKNRPKLASDHAEPSSNRTPDPVYAFDSRHEQGSAPAPVTSTIIFFPTAAPRGGERYAWVRTKLRPGEAWKRRLPKVIW